VLKFNPLKLAYVVPTPARGNVPKTDGVKLVVVTPVLDGTPKTLWAFIGLSVLRFAISYKTPL
jgi:hypothetical protein